MNCKALLLIDADNLSTNKPIALYIFYFCFILPLRKAVWLCPNMQILSIFVLIALILFCVNSDILTNKFCFIICNSYHIWFPKSLI